MRATKRSPAGYVEIVRRQRRATRNDTFAGPNVIALSPSG